LTGVSDKIKNIVNFLTSPFDSGREEDIFDDMTQEFQAEYPTAQNAALEPAFKQAAAPRGGHMQERPLKVVPLSNKTGHEVVVFEPRAYNESIIIVEALKERKTVILNLQLLDREQSQRIVDFLCGCTHALDGNQRKIGEFVFIFTPNNINLTQEMLNSKFSRDALWSQPQ
jgi:FtsZ-interacting cell division protein YlmF